MTAIIRPYQPGDELGMAFAHSQSILQLCSRDYPAEAIVKWAVKKPEKYLRNSQQGETFWVAEQNDQIIGFAAWEKQELSGFYLHPEYVGQGVGRRLFEVLEQDYRAKTNATAWQLESTITAKPFYEAMGFATVAAATHTFRDGVTTIPVWKMLKTFVK
ncbi:MAG: GNAT family N-acetyltransferase [Alphaproteobacteria bacterium]|nr:GNAT family N-acetyltransferase [Alphaproteobacteria bacterium]